MRNNFLTILELLIYIKYLTNSAKATSRYNHSIVKYRVNKNKQLECVKSKETVSSGF